MTSHRTMLHAALWLSTAAVAPAQSSTTPPTAGPVPAPALFERLKALAGHWTGRASTGGAAPESFPVDVSLRVTSGGDALMHEMTPAGRRDDPARGEDDPVTMFYLDGARLRLTHYCDRGKNRPRMTARTSSDGRTVEFDFLDLAGATRFGHMHHARFTFIDADHHTEDWTWMMPDGTTTGAHIDVTRAKE